MMFHGRRAVARLGFVPSNSLLQQLLFIGYIHMEQMTPQELANLAWALATMRARPGAVWLARLHVQVVAKAPAMSAQEVANTAWAVHQLSKVHQGTAAQQVSASVSMQLPGHQPGGMTSVWQALLHSAASKVDSFRSQELLMLLMPAQELLSARTSTRGSLVSGSIATKREYDIVLLHAAHTLLQPGAAFISPSDVANLLCMVTKAVLTSVTAATGSSSSPWDSAMGRLGKAHAVAAAVNHLQERAQHLSLKV
jgi:hypothetical protein